MDIEILKSQNSLKPSGIQAPDRIDFAVIAIITLLALTLRLGGIDAQGLWHDELYTMGNLVGFDLYLFPGADLSASEPVRPAETQPEPAKPAPAVVPEPAPKPAPKAVVAPATPAPKEEPAAAPDAPAATGKPQIPAAVGEPDNLRLIKGVGPKLNTLLISLGVTRFDQIAEWKEAEINEVDQYLDTFAGRITRDAWIDQAKFLAKDDIAGFEKKYGKL